LKRQQIGTKPMVNWNTLLKKLKKRYNMAHNTNIIYNVTLPNSCANAKIVTNSAKWCIQSLLTDPSIKDSDYLFHNDNQIIWASRWLGVHVWYKYRGCLPRIL
jgi:hypothetical protein